MRNWTFYPLLPIERWTLILKQWLCLGVCGFGSCHCFGCGVGCAAMASAKGVGETLYGCCAVGGPESLFIKVSGVYFLSAYP